MEAKEMVDWTLLAGLLAIALAIFFGLKGFRIRYK